MIYEWVLNIHMYLKIVRHMLQAHYKTIVLHGLSESMFADDGGI
jgi:hypothetical protein